MYAKSKERLVGTFAEAEALADEFFAPFGKVTPQGRTTETAKVRIRRQGTARKEGGFRVVLYEKVREKQEVEVKEPAAEAPRKRRPRHRRDRKGKRWEKKRNGKR